MSFSFCPHTVADDIPSEPQQVSSAAGTYSTLPTMVLEAAETQPAPPAQPATTVLQTQILPDSSDTSHTGGLRFFIFFN